MTKERIKALVRLGVTLALVALTFLITFGVIDADKITASVGVVLSIASTVWAWWKDNNITSNAMKIHGIEDKED